jgi:CRISPR-associated protein Cas1
LAARAGTPVAWGGERVSSSTLRGSPGAHDPTGCSFRARLALDESAPLKVVRKMYSMRFGEDAPERRSVEQLRGMEGARVKRLCELHARENAVNCRRRDHNPANCSGPDPPNRCLSAAPTCLYGLAEAAIFAPGYAPAAKLRL